MYQNTLGLTSENVNVGAIVIKTYNPNNENDQRVIKIYKSNSKGVLIEDVQTKHKQNVSWFDLCVKYKFSGSPFAQQWIKKLISETGHKSTIPFLGNRLAINDELSKKIGVKFIDNQDDKTVIDPLNSQSYTGLAENPDMVEDDFID